MTCALGAAPACTWVVDATAAQCEVDGDCARFAGARCDRIKRVCVAPPSPMVDAGGVAGDAAVVSCRGPAGCGACSPGRTPGLGNFCSDVMCLPFDNGRLRRSAPDGGLRPLPTVAP